MIDKKRLKELPKWAEDEIRRLQRDLEDAKKLLQSICGDKNSNTRLCSFGEEEIPLIHGVRVKFILQNGKEISCAAYHGVLNIHSIYSVSVLPVDTGQINVC